MVSEIYSVRMFTPKELQNMKVPFIEDSIYLNIAGPDEDFPQVKEDIKKHMRVINYMDFSETDFSESALRDSIKRQKKTGSEIIMLSAFRKEHPYDTRLKIEVCKELKAESNNSVLIILEIPYSSEIPITELNGSSASFDILSLYYGVAYGHINSLIRIVEKTIEFKSKTDKKVMVMAAPIKFSGEDMTDVRLMPCLDLIVDFWSRSWKSRGGPKEVKLTDQTDLKSKTYQGFLESGYAMDYLLPGINMTVREIFRKENKESQKDYENMILDEVLSDMHNYTPSDITEKILNSKFHTKYFWTIFAAYNEKVISLMFKHEAVFSELSEEDRGILENELRKKKLPSELYINIERLKTFVETHKDANVTVLLSLLNKKK